jgi:hypothetical protein
LFTYLTLFSGVVYAVLPEQLGGGRPLHIQLLFKPEEARTTADLGVPMESSGLLSRRIPLLFEREGSYICPILRGDGTSVIAEVTKSIVKAKVVSPKQQRPLFVLFVTLGVGTVLVTALYCFSARINEYTLAPRSKGARSSQQSPSLP